MPAEQGSLKVHFFYVTLILVLTIIGLVTHKWTGIEEFRDYLSVGATMTSLVLGVLAIIYSFVSNGQQQSVLGAVESAAKSANTSAEKIGTLMNVAQSLQTDAEARAGELKSLSESLSVTVDDLRGGTEAILSTNADLAHKVNSLPGQIGEIKGMLQESFDSKSLPDSATEVGSLDAELGGPVWSLEMVKKALEGSSLYGLALICAFVRASRNDQLVSFKKFGSALESGDGEYGWGYTMGFARTGLLLVVEVEASAHADAEDYGDLFELEYINDDLKATAETALASRLEARHGALSDGVEKRFRDAITACCVPRHLSI